MGAGSLSTPQDIKVKLIQSIVGETGWLTWTEYIYLFLAQQVGSVGGWLCIHEWTRNKKRLDEQLSFLEDVMEEPEIKPFEPVLRKVIERCLLEMELRKTYPQEVKTRYRDFHISGRSLSFVAEDLEDEKDTG